MADCCHDKACDLEKMPKDQSQVLWIVLAINAVMFVVELVSGILADSVSLTGDSLDMLGDSLAYASSLYVINMGVRAKARSAIFKSALMLGSAAIVLARALYRTFYQATPDLTIMGGIGTLALAMNVTCLVLLTRHRDDDINMSSVWLCSRNDIVANVAVLGAAGLVFYTAASWPDLVVGFGITVLFTVSAFKVFRQSRLELRSGEPQRATATVPVTRSVPK
jgi:cation diffusion facilitator family transporter